MKTFFFTCMTLAILMAVQTVTIRSAYAQDTREEELDHQRRLRNDFRKEQWRRNFDAAAYLKEQDKNKDGVLGPEEIEGRRTKQFLERLGIPTGKASKIEDLVKNLNRRNANEAEQKRKAFRDRLSTLDSFGAPAGSVGVDQFGVDDRTEGLQTFDETSTGMKASDFDDKSLKKADKLLGTFDRDRNGFLDGDEILRLSWKSPPPESSDLNRDGRLSKLELAKRFSVRETKAEKTKTKKKKSKSEQKSDRSRAVLSEKTSSKLDPRSRRSGRDDQRKSSGRAVAKAKANAKSSKGYQKYVDSQFKKYDANSDGKLDKEELSATSLLKKAEDSDGDGMISKQEAITLVSRGKSKTSSAPKNGTKKTSSEKVYSRRSPSVRPSSSVSQRAALTTIDVDGDGQIQMHEYSDTWTVEKLNEFRAKDKNGDGLLSRSEWNGKGRGE